ncbi:MAG: class I SAM-dependent methyltransferase [Gammaproteobacteria bacterium]|nr:class I SAM-dependent methyltransferase [Gammaproteobacteria bacterium]
MSTSTLGLSPQVNQYIQNVTVTESDVLKALREETAQLSMSVMQISPEQGQLMSLLAKLTKAKRIIEVGVFTGYSSICLAKELPEHGELIACDVSEEWTNIAKRYWQQAGLQNKIQLKLAPALETLDALIEQGHAASFDMAFIDADKENYQQYFDQCFALLRPGGLILVDNTLWSGDVADPNIMDEETTAIRELNMYIAKHQQVMSSLVPISDGLTLAIKL